MKLAWKLAIPQIIIVACLGLISYLVIDSSFVRLREQHVRDVIENRFLFITNEIDISSQKSVSETSVFIHLPAVMRAYEIAMSGDMDDPYSPETQAAREFLRKELALMLDSYTEVTGKRLQLHFHLPNGRSLVRLWRDKNTRIDGEWVDYSDDLYAIRPTIREVIKSGEPVLGLEPGSGGFAIRGVIPVKTPDGRQIGSAEVLQDFDPIIETATVEGKIYISLYANIELLDFSVELQDSEKYPPKGDFVRVVGAKDISVESLITPELLARGKDGAYSEVHGSMTLTTFPLSDYNGKQVGVLICTMNTEEVSILANTASIILALMLAGMAIAPTFALLLRLHRLAVRPLNMIKSKIQDIAEDRADLSEHIPSYQKDEIGELARWFNTLTSKLDGILKDRQMLLGQIRSESEKFESTAHWYRSILDATPLPITVTDNDMNWTFVNKAVEDFLGTKLEDMLGKPCSNWNAHICNTPNCGIACVKRGVKQTFFTQNERSHKVDVEILKDLNGEVSGFIEVVQDITQVEEMAKQEGEAKAASHAKSDFLANMSHEMRTPMNAIIGMTAIGKSSNDLERAKYTLSKIEDASIHLLGIINDILDMSKIEAGKFELSEEEFRFEKMLQRVVNVISFRVDEKKQKLNLRVDKNLPDALIGDDQRLAQVIANLMGNAVKFTPDEGSISLNASLAGEKDGFCEIQVEVIDSGIGISREQQARLFQSFNQAEKNTSRKFGGTGLGLSISKSIVEMMNGKIWVESEAGKGAKFAFTVWIKRGDPDRYEAVKEQAGDAIETAPVIFKGKHILLAEDVAINREIVLTLFEPTLLEIDCAVNGAEAVRLFRETPDKYDLILMDIQMPGVDGYEATRQIRALDTPKAKTIPIIAMTANVFLDDIEKSHAAGMNDHVGKPFDVNEVIEKLRQYLF